jgi:hypothetical protein
MTSVGRGSRLTLDGPAWRTPGEHVVERSQDLVAHPPEFGLEGVVELGPHRERVERLEARLSELRAYRCGTVSWYPAEVSVVASLHGPSDRPVPDAALRELLGV